MSDDDPRATVDEMRAAAAAVVAWWMNETDAPPHVMDALKLQRMADESVGTRIGRAQQHEATVKLIDSKMRRRREAAEANDLRRRPWHGEEP